MPESANRFSNVVSDTSVIGLGVAAEESVEEADEFACASIRLLVGATYVWTDPS
jgi:hypothetical protein